VIFFRRKALPYRAKKKLQTARILDEFAVRRFRSLDDVTLRQLGGCNLLVGANNSGKTSILEALAVFASPLDISAWGIIARMREVRHLALSRGLSSVEAIRWLFGQHANGTPTAPGLRGEFNLLAKGEWRVRDLAATCTEIRGLPPEPPRRPVRVQRDLSPLEEDQGWLVNATISLNNPISTDEANRVEAQLWPSVGYYRGDRRTGPHLPAVTLAPYSHRNQPMQLRRLSELIESNEKFSIVRLLTDLDPNIKDIEIITDRYTGAPSMLVRHRISGPVPVSVLGDGFRRALEIALAIPRARGGLLLIDEIETALYVTFLQKLFSWLIRACQEFGVQLFATTHSLEAITAMVNAIPDDSEGTTVAYHLGAPPEPSPKRYSAEMIQRLVRDRGLDIR
jgi:hypothetical protein